MTKKKELTVTERGIIISFYEAGVPERTISERTGHPKTTIHDTIMMYKKRGVLTSASRSGRPKKLTERDKRHLKSIICKERREPAQKIQESFANSTGNEVGKNTIRRALYEMGYHSRIALRKPYISESNRRFRLKWTRERRSWTINEWKKVIWSDESRFTLFQNDGKVHVWRLPKEKYDVNCLVPTVKHGGGGVMMWGCFSWYGMGPLVRIDG